MMNGTDPQLALDLAKQRGAELRAAAERHRLARRAQARAHEARAHAARARPDPLCEQRAPQPPARVLSWRRG
jgi:hypothetical protein